MVDIQTILIAIFIAVIYMLLTGGEWKMNRIEQNMLESMSDTIDKLKDELTMTRQDYEALLEEVIVFFKKVRNGLDPVECIEEFDIGLSNYCNIEVTEEIGFKSNTGEK